MPYHPRWQEDENGALKPLISRIHVIPLEGETMLHCAQVTCWCSPVEASDSDQIIFNHIQATGEASGWVLIGELDHSDVD